MIGYLSHYAKHLLQRVGYTKPVRVVWADMDTACTNGIVIHFPRTMDGLKFDTNRPTKKAMLVAKGLILHECGHFLQPLKAIREAEQQTGLNHFYTNIFLDVQLERVAQRIWKKDIDNLYALRRFTRRIMYRQYQADYDQAMQDLENGDPEAWPTLAATVNLLGRFHKKDKPYFLRATINKRKRTITVKPTIGKIKITDTLLFEFHKDTWRVPMAADSLAENVRIIAAKYPELCNPDLELPKLPGMMLGASDGDQEDGDLPGSNITTDNTPDLEKIMQDVGHAAQDLCEIVFTDTPRGKPYPEAVRLAMKLRLQLRKDTASNTIIAPVDINRRGFASGELQPWTQTYQLGKAKNRKVVLLLDCSYSMVSSGIQQPAFIAAQAICLAVESEQGSVTGGQFGKNGMMSENLDASPLFDGIRVNDEDTTFKILTPAWLFCPESTVIMITDGRGHMPSQIRPEDKQRTHIIGLRTMPSEADQLGITHLCEDIDDLPKILMSIVN